MKNIVHSYVRKFREERRKSHRAVALLLALALVVSTGVSWQLHATGIALTNETYCGLEEHTHTEDCYEQVLVCGQEESEGHTHTDACYETETTLVCGKEESEGHTHDESCYDEDGNLICGKEESEGHTHTDACYETETVLVCGQEESEGHTHTDSCYETQMTCGKEEHTHTVDCLTDETADVETAADWEATLPELTGVWADDVAAIAKSQLGYTESTANFTLADDGETRQGYTRYGAWYGNEYGDWDAMFASFCLYYAGVDEEAFPQASGVYAWTVALNELGLYDEDAEPTNGDLVFFDTDKDGKADHVGVVAGVSDYKVTVIEGDSDDKVQSTAYSLNDSTITGYGVLPEQEETEDEAEAETETYTLTYEGEDFTVTVTYGEDAELPEGVELIASEYAQDSETYLARYAEAAELYGWNTGDEEDEEDAVAETEDAAETDYYGFRLFNIGFYVDGEEVEPAADVTVTITYLYKDELQTYTVTHFGDESTETMDATSDYADGNQTVQFNSNAFSDYGTSLTADGDSNYTIAVGETVTITGTKPTGNYTYTYSWGSSNTNIATVTSYSENEAIVTGVSAGTVTITYVYSYNTYWYGQLQPNNVQATYTVTVTDGGSIVLNLGNGNGVLQDSDYSGGSQGSGGADLRYTVNVSNAADEDGNATINLPADSDLGNTFTVATGTDGAITQALGNEAAPYAWKLIGWVNIATGEYYDVSGGSVTVTVDLDDDNVFYADWIAESYNYGSSSSLGEDTSDFVKIEMFDYNELFNMYSASLTQNGLTSESWADSGNLYSSILQSGSVLDKSFIFHNSRTNNSNDNISGSNGLLGYVTNMQTWNQNVNNLQQQNQWSMSSALSSSVLDMLYDTSGDTVGVTYVGSGNYLFQVDEDTGYYYFDSDQNGAAYNQSAQRFYLSSSTTTVNGYGSAFFPYNDVTSYSSISDGTLNYWFGMSVELDFYLPNDVGTNGGNQYNNNDMVFEFSGDDDVWVYVDDELVLDLGAIHDVVSGTINFSTGEVTVNGSVTSTLSNCSAGTHTLKVYYMERGAWDSNLSIKFNVVPRWKYETASAGTMSVTKEWSDSESTHSAVSMGLFEKTSTTASAGNTVIYGGTSYELDSDGYSYDSATGYVNAYVNGGYLYVLVDTQEVSADNNWTYTWELLNIDKTYEVLELTNLSNYKTTSTYSALQSYNYWSAVGYEELNGTVTYSNGTYSRTGGILQNGLAILLTDGAQTGTESTSNFPTTYTGYVIDSGSSVSTKEAQFSQKATSDSSGTYTYGVTSDSYISNTSVWTVELTGEYASFTESGNPYYAPTFYLKDSSGNYLTITGSSGSYTLTTSSNGTAFSYNSLGELNTEDSTGLRVTISSGNYALVTGRQNETDTKNVKIYVKQDVTTTGKDYTITNTLLPTITLKKVDSTDSTKTLSGAVFTLQNSEGKYYSYSSNAVAWVNSSELRTDSYGNISFTALPDGTYTLTEVTAPDGYNTLSGTISITVSGGVITEATYGGSESNVVSYDSDSTSLILTVANTPGVELPETGGSGTWLYTLTGLTLCGGAALLLFRRKETE